MTGIKKFRAKKKFIFENKEGKLIVGVSALGQYRYVGIYDSLELAEAARNAVLEENELMYLVEEEYIPKPKKRASRNRSKYIIKR
ncbi:MAG: hypothetical protein QJT81_12330 [Candidatus Thiothrix putei]|uniref:Uncharacterized protein n=1 Tax=Candidatus Thiothrix putei TaxID=3080811 RepID=A0AA95H870_9GAMM|nr:MAG: hypothetical protein QJT81_12330 [Candidatus Thiothrix putei]